MIILPALIDFSIVSPCVRRSTVDFGLYAKCGIRGSSLFLVLTDNECFFCFGFTSGMLFWWICYMSR